MRIHGGAALGAVAFVIAVCGTAHAGAICAGDSACQQSWGSLSVPLSAYLEKL